MNTEINMDKSQHDQIRETQQLDNAWATAVERIKAHKALHVTPPKDFVPHRSASFSVVAPFMALDESQSQLNN